MAGISEGDARRWDYDWLRACSVWPRKCTYIETGLIDDTKSRRSAESEKPVCS